MSDLYTGFRSFTVSESLLNEFHDKWTVKVWDKRLAFYPNMYVELKNESNEKSTGLGRVSFDGNNIDKIDTKRTASGLRPRNREQVFFLDALLEDKIPIVVCTGLAGGGKSLLALAAALDKIQHKVYKKVILTRPMSQVGKYQLGSLPGGVSEKYNPFLLNYITNLEQLVGERHVVEDLIEQLKFEAVPIQLMRGASFVNTLIIADEIQVLPFLDILTIGTRIGDGSKLVLMGDLNQRDENIPKEKTGLYKMMQDKRAKDSPLVSALELIKCERSAAARLFAEIFEE